MFKQLSTNLKIINFFAVVILTSSLIAIFVSAKANSDLDQKIVDIKEQQRPANVSITIIKDSSCQECFDVNNVLANIKKFNLNIESEESIEYDSNSAQTLIDKYKINKIPSLIIKGELEKEQDFNNVLGQIGTIDNSTFVSRQLPPPYTSLDSGELVGKIALTMLTDSSCKDCYDVNNHKKIMTSFGAYIADQKLLDVQTSEGRHLLNKYNIELLPTIILSKDASDYLSLKSVWPNVGTIEEDGSYVSRQGVKSMGVYKDMTSNQVVDPKSQVANQ